MGTSGYSYKDWVGAFYPEGMKQGEFLGYYSERFSFVELNFSYYRQPEPAMIERMRRQVPEGFLFSIKAHQSLTHRREAGWKNECLTFQRGIDTILEHGQCAAVLLQFPYSFHYTPENRRYLADLTEQMSSLPLAVEFRNSEWEQESVLQEMRERSIALVLTDMPDLERLPKISEDVTGEDAYFRFHGRNTRNWWSGDNVSRYDYLYSEDELQERLGDLLKVMEKAKRLFIAFNNHRKGQAVQNAFDLLKLMEKTDAT